MSVTIQKYALSLYCHIASSYSCHAEKHCQPFCSAFLTASRCVHFDHHWCTDYFFTDSDRFGSDNQRFEPVGLRQQAIGETAADIEKKTARFV